MSQQTTPSVLISIRLDKADFMSWCAYMQWRIPSTMKLTTFIAWKTDN